MSSIRDGPPLISVQPGTPKASTLPFSSPIHNSSSYTLRTIVMNDSDELLPTSSSALLPTASTSYGTTTFGLRSARQSYRSWSTRRPLLNTAIQMAVLFIVSSILLGGTLWLALPRLEEADRQYLRIPKTFDQLKELNTLLKKYRDIYPYRIVICYVTTYLFLQAFSLPGSMYLSILAGAVWGVYKAIPLACSSVATGATLCYLISAALAPALLSLPKWKERLDRWAQKVDEQRSNLFSFLIVLRIAPFPPHWVVNVICPHVGIGIPMFWTSTWAGILGVTIIHTTIGSGLDEMTSADDFHLISWRNFFGLALIVVAVLIPVGLRYVWKKELQGIAEVDAGVPPREEEDDEARAPLLGYVDEEEETEDVILQAGPAVAMHKGKQTAKLLGDGLNADAKLVLLNEEEEDAELEEGRDSGSEDEVIGENKERPFLRY